MSHELSRNGKGEWEFAFAGELPWHGLGDQKEQRMTAAQGLERIPWEVEKFPLFTRMPDGTVLEVPEKMAIVRLDCNRVLNVVGIDYTAIQNPEQAKFIEALCGESGAVVECVGALYGGRRTFWTCKLDQAINIQTGNFQDRINEYLIVSNAHDGSHAFRAFWSPIRVVCRNTLVMAEKKDAKSGFVLRHTSKVQDRIEEARRILGIAIENHKLAARSYAALAEAKTFKEQYEDILREIFPDADKDSPRAQENVEAARLSCLENLREESQALKLGKVASLWQAYNSVTYYTSHQLVRKSGRSDEEAAASRRFDSILLGRGAELNRAALGACLKRLPTGMGVGAN